jgi:hypothetical protein
MPLLRADCSLKVIRFQQEGARHRYFSWLIPTKQKIAEANSFATTAIGRRSVWASHTAWLDIQVGRTRRFISFELVAFRSGKPLSRLHKPKQEQTKDKASTLVSCNTVNKALAPETSCYCKKPNLRSSDARNTHFNP